MHGAVLKRPASRPAALRRLPHPPARISTSAPCSVATSSSEIRAKAETRLASRHANFTTTLLLRLPDSTSSTHAAVATIHGCECSAMMDPRWLPAMIVAHVGFKPYCRFRSRQVSATSSWSKDTAPTRVNSRWTWSARALVRAAKRQPQQQHLRPSRRCSRRQPQHGSRRLPRRQRRLLRPLPRGWSDRVRRASNSGQATGTGGTVGLPALGKFAATGASTTAGASTEETTRPCVVCAPLWVPACAPDTRLRGRPLGALGAHAGLTSGRMKPAPPMLAIRMGAC